MTRRKFLGGALTAVGAAAGFGGALSAAEFDLSKPRRHLIMRHALAPGGGDPARFELRDCATQRNLDDRGRAQARATGERLRSIGATPDRVLSSQWCRCLETARLLGLGPVVEAPQVNSFFQDRSSEPAQTAATKELLLALPPSVSALLVTHQVNITALFNVFPRSGEVFLFEITPSGRVQILDSLLVPA